MNLFSKLQGHLSNGLLDDSFREANRQLKSNMYKLHPVHMYKESTTNLFHPQSFPFQLMIIHIPKCSDFDAILAQLSQRHVVHLQLYWKIHPE